MNASIPKRLSLAGLVLIVLSLPVVIYGAWQFVHTGANDVAQWVHPAFPARQAYDRFCNLFGSGDIAVISWTGCTIDNARLDRLHAALQSEDRAPYIDQVVTGRQAFEQLVSPPLNLERSEAVKRLRGSLVGPDGVTTCVFVSLSEAGKADREKTIAKILETISHECQVDRRELHLAGPAFDAYYLDRATDDSLKRFGGLSALITFVMSILFLRSIRMGLIVFCTALFCQAVVLSLLYACDEMNAVLIILPTLLLVLGVSGGVHLVNYYVEGADRVETHGAAARALAQGWLPCALSAGTTAIGLGSLLVSGIAPIRNFGWYGAVGMAVILVAILAIVPGACEWSALFPYRLGSRVIRLPANMTGRSGRLRLPTFLLRRPRTVLAVFVVAMVVAAFGLPALRTSVRIDTLFHRESPLIRDYAWIERNVGPLVPVEVLLRFDADCPLHLCTRLQIVRDLEHSLKTIPQVAATVSAATFLPPPSKGADVRSVVRRRLAERYIERRKHELVKAGRLRETDDGELWRITARVSLFHDRPYDELVEDIHRRAAKVLAEIKDKPTAGIRVTVTGMAPLSHEVQQALMNDLVKSFLCALTLIALVMIVSLRSIVLGLAAMVPNVFPVVVLFGTLGWIGVPVDIASVMTASLALGMAIDGTQHFVAFFRQSLNSGHSVERAVTAAYRHCSRAILVSALICGLGLAAFAASSFATVSRCSIIICSALVVMTLGDLILLPAILLLTGRRFLSRRESAPEADESARRIRGQAERRIRGQRRIRRILGQAGIWD